MQNRYFNKQILYIVMIMMVALCFCYAKSGYFLDEIYSYGLSNSEYAPFLKNVMGGDITGKVINHADLFGYVTAGKSRFNYASVYYNQTQDVHPPLYYWILHTICSIFPDTFSKWMGLFPNIVFYALTIYLLLKISNDLFGHAVEISLSVIILYGLSAAGLSTLVFVRMYMLMTLLTVLLAYVVLKIMKNKRWYLYPSVAGVIFLGLLTQYYFVIYAFIICLFYVVHQWKKKQYGNAFMFSFFAMLGVVGMYLAFPDCIMHVTKGTGTGTTVWRQLLAYNEYASRCYGLFRQIIRSLFVTCLCMGGVLLTLILNFQRVKEGLRHTQNAETAIIVIPAFLATLVIICISTPTLRYIYNLMPFYVLAAGYMMFVLKNMDGTSVQRLKRCVGKCFLPMTFCAGIVFSLIFTPNYLYKEYKQYNQLIKPYKKCIYISDNINPCITSDIDQLLNFNEVFASNISNISKQYMDIQNYMESVNEAVIYISKYKNLYGCDMVIDALLNNMDYYKIEKLYEGDFSAAYLIERNE